MEEVIEAASVEAIGEAAVADVVEGAVFAELNGIDTTAGRDTGARTGTEGGPIVSSGVSTVRQFGEENRSRGIFDDGFVEASRFPVRELAASYSAKLKVNSCAVSWIRKRRSEARYDEVWTGPVHGVSAAAAVGRPIDALFDFVGRTFEDFWNAAGAGESTGDAENQVGIGSGATNVAMDVIIPGKLVLVIAGGVGGGRNLIVVVRGPQGEPEAELFQVVGAFDALRTGLRAAEGRQEQAGKNGDDSDDDEQLDEREGELPAEIGRVGIFHGGLRVLVGDVNLQIFIDDELFAGGCGGNAREITGGDDFLKVFWGALFFGGVFADDLREFGGASLGGCCIGGSIRGGRAGESGGRGEDRFGGRGLGRTCFLGASCKEKKRDDRTEEKGQNVLRLPVAALNHEER